MSMLVQDFLQHSADRLPDKIALVCEGQRLTYAEIEAMANRLANALHAQGVKRGDRVAIYLPNSVAGILASEPPNLPTAVRAAPTMTMSSMCLLLLGVVEECSVRVPAHFRPWP